MRTAKYRHLIDPNNHIVLEYSIQSKFFTDYSQYFPIWDEVHIKDRAKSLANEIFDIIGLVDDLDDFYRQIDIAINPMVGGTGLKIKSLEALSYGKALLATEDAMVGIDGTDAFHNFASVPEMVGALKSLSKERLEVLHSHSIETFQSYNERFINEFKSLFVE